MGDIIKVVLFIMIIIHYDEMRAVKDIVQAKHAKPSNNLKVIYPRFPGQFTLWYEQTTHKKQHTKNIKCGIDSCQRLFMSNSDRRRHQYFDHKGPPYTCPVHELKKALESAAERCYAEEDKYRPSDFSALDISRLKIWRSRNLSALKKDLKKVIKRGYDEKPMHELPNETQSLNALKQEENKILFEEQGQDFPNNTTVVLDKKQIKWERFCFESDISEQNLTNHETLNDYLAFLDKNSK